MTVESILRRRRAERDELLARAARFAGSIPGSLKVRAVCVFGSVARGDFNLWSDVDVLVVAENLPSHPLRRLETLEPIPPRVQPIVWTPSEWLAQQARRDPIAVEARQAGVWLIGAADAL